jgi:hypothetical protein
MGRNAITNDEIEVNLIKTGFTGCSSAEGRLHLMELIVKAGAGYYNSHTEEGFLNSFGLMKKDRTPNKKGREFLMRMIYASSCKRPQCHALMTEFRV